MGETKSDNRAQAQTVEALERLRYLMQAVIDYNQPLLRSSGQRAAAARRIAEATRQIVEIEREIAALHASET